MTSEGPVDPEEAVAAEMDAVIDHIIKIDPEWAYTEGLIDTLPPEFLERIGTSDGTAGEATMTEYKQQFTLAPDVQQQIKDKCEELGISMARLARSLVQETLEKGVAGRVPEPGTWGRRTKVTSIQMTEPDWQDAWGYYYPGFGQGHTNERGRLIASLLGAFAMGSVTVTVTLDIDLGEIDY